MVPPCGWYLICSYVRSTGLAPMANMMDLLLAVEIVMTTTLVNTNMFTFKMKSGEYRNEEEAKTPQRPSKNESKYKYLRIGSSIRFYSPKLLSLLCSILTTSVQLIKIKFADHDDEDDRPSKTPDNAILQTEPAVVISRVLARG